MKKENYSCKYCGNKMHQFDYETYNGYCGKCRQIIDWEKTLGELKDFKNEEDSYNNLNYCFVIAHKR